jgi:SAM-dependent methyltransferase
MTPWKESKYRYSSRGLIASKDVQHVSVSSRIVCTLVGQFYSEQIPRHVRGKLIDLGCGSAPLYGAYAPISACQHFLDVEDRLGHFRLHYRASLNEPLSCIRQQYDSAILSDVLEHLADPMTALSSIHSLLNKGGVLLMTVPFLYGIHEAPYDYRRFTKYGLNFELERAGFTQIDIHEIGGLASVISTLSAKLLASCFGENSVLVKLLVSLQTALLRLPVFTWIDRKTSRRFPLEYGIICYKDS